MAQNSENGLVCPDVPQYQGVIRSTREQYVCYIVKLDVRDIALVAYEASYKSLFIDIVHIDQSVIPTRSDVRLNCPRMRAKLNIIYRKEVIFEFMY